MEAELQTAKKTIRSLLISVKEGLSVAELERDFVEFEGTKLPFAKFGFTNARAFLQSLTDVVHFFQDANGYEKMKQVSDETTIHIERLVARQKSDTRKKKTNKTPLNRQTLLNYGSRGKRGSGNARGGRQFNRGYMQPFASCSSGQPFARHSSGQLVDKFPQKSAPGQASRNTRAPLLSAPFRPGGPNTNDIRPGSGLKHVMNESSSREKVAQFVADLPLENRSQNSVETLVKSGMAQYAADIEQKENISQNKKKTLGKSSQQSKAMPQRKADAVSGQVSRDKPELAAAKDPYLNFHSSRHQNDSDLNDDLWEDDFKNFSTIEDDCIINQGVQDKIKQVLCKAPKGMWANRLPVMYKQMFQQELPWKENGFNSVIEFVSELPHVVRIERPYANGDWLLSDITMPRVEDNEPGSQHQKLVSQITRRKNLGPPKSQSGSKNIQGPFKSLDDFKESVRQVLQHQTEGVLLDHFPQVYEEMTGHLLDPMAFGHDDMVSLLLFLAEQDVLTMNYDGRESLSPESTRLIGVCKSGMRCFDLLKDAYKPHPNHGMRTNQKIPDGVVGPGRCYPPATMEGVERGGRCEVHVSSVNSPNLFWVQKRCDIRRLDDLMDSLEEEYSVEANKYRMPPSLMMHGQVCAALFEDNDWHRGIITGTSEGKVLVYFVDYGSSSSVDPATICFLMEKFLSLPVQAMQAKLAYLMPPKDQKTFSKAAKEELLRLVMQRPLHALVSDIENLVLLLVLVDTSEVRDVCINDELVDRGLASFIPEDTAAKNGAVDGRGDLSRQQSGDSSGSSTPLYGEGRRYVRLLEFSPDIEFHVVYFGGELLVVSSEISCLFWEEDCLAFMLQQEKMVLQKVVMSRQQCPPLFDELTRRGAFFMDENVKLLNLYRLENLALLLDLFGDQSQKAEDLKQFVGTYLDTFDHNDPYWKSADEESVSVGEEGEVDPEDVLTLEELQLALHSMQINRKRILRRMTLEPECMSETVKELESTEDSILQIQELIQALEQSHSTDLKLPASGKPSPSLPESAPLTVDPQSKTNTTSFAEVRSQEPRGAVKTNVVTPMVKPTQTPAPPAVPGVAGGLAPGVPLTDLPAESLELMRANQRLAEEIRQKDQIIGSMLGGGGAALPMTFGGGGGMGLGLQHFPPQGGHPGMPPYSQHPKDADRSRHAQVLANPGLFPGEDTQPQMFGDAARLQLEGSQCLQNSGPAMVMGRPQPGEVMGREQDGRNPMHAQSAAQSMSPPVLTAPQVLQSQQVLQPQQVIGHLQSDKEPGLFHEGNLEAASSFREEWKRIEAGGLAMEAPTAPALPQFAASLKPGILPLPAVGVVRPHPAAQPAVHLASQGGACPPCQPAPVALYPAPGPRLAAFQPVPARPLMGLLPRPSLFRGPVAVPATWPDPGPMPLQQQFMQLQRRQMALLQQQAMVRTHVPSAVSQPGSAPLPGSGAVPGYANVGSVGDVRGRVVGGDFDPGEGHLLPGMVPLLQSFQESCSVQPPPLPSSPATLPGSQ